MKIALIPIYNESRTLLHVLESVNWADHIVMIDDGSTDGSGDIARDWQQRHAEKVHLIRLERNQGVSAALKAGFVHIAKELACGRWRPEDIVVMLDADDQYRDADPARLCAYLEERGCDLVIVRRDFSPYPRYKRLGNKLLTLWASRVCGQEMHDIEAGLRAMRIRVIPPLLEYYAGWRYSWAQEVGVIAVLLGFKVDNELLQPVSYYRSRTRISHFLINALMGLVSAWRVRVGYKNRPGNP